jgi:hypothetical protein
MALRGDKLVIRASDESSSSTPSDIIAESTDCSLDLSAEALESTSQTSGLNAEYIAGKISGTASGSYLLAADGTNFTNLFTAMNAGTVIDVEVQRDGTQFIQCNGVITSLSLSGGLSDSLATGSYTIQLSGNPATA